MFQSAAPKRTLSLIIFLLAGLTIYSQPTTDIGKKANYIKKIITANHYNKIQFDDSYSEKVFDQFINTLDPAGLFFFQEDIDALKAKYQFSIDLEVKQGTSQFFDATANLFHDRLVAVRDELDEWMNQKIDWNSDEILSYNESIYADFVSSENDLKERWRLWLKYATLDELFSGGYHADPNHTTIDSVLLYEKEAKAEVLEMEQYEIKTFLEHPAGYRTYIGSLYLDALATVIDPHSTYFSPSAQEDFVEDLSKDNYAFGIQLDENEKGAVFIYGLLPGSPAWISNELNKGDIVLDLKLGDGQFLDLSQAGMDEVNLLFANSTSEVLVMHVRKANGQEKEVILEKGVIYVDQDVIKSVVIQGDERIGYITLPDFYTDWGEEGAAGCANDVAKTIVKLQKENISGLILDLRNNGGGSLKEAIDLAGIFINYGPVGIFQDQSREPASIKDFNKGSIYNGPLVILVNGLSASASEIFTAAMQDYNRAIIVGSKTYGKSTGQVMLPLDPMGIDESLGYLKITTSKYYRITKSTHQKEGVIPDVPLPDIYDIYDYRESSYENALLKDSVEKKVYYTPFEDFPTTYLNQQSQNRMQEKGLATSIEKLVDSLQFVYNNQEEFPLKIAEYQTYSKNLETSLEHLFALIESDSADFEIVNNQFDQKIMEMNTYRSELNEIYLKRLKKDIYLGEAYHVLADYITFNK